MVEVPQALNPIPGSLKVFVVSHEPQTLHPTAWPIAFCTDDGLSENIGLGFTILPRVLGLRIQSCWSLGVVSR